MYKHGDSCGSVTGSTAYRRRLLITFPPDLADVPFCLVLLKSPSARFGGKAHTHTHTHTHTTQGKLLGVVLVCHVSHLTRPPVLLMRIWFTRSSYLSRGLGDSIARRPWLRRRRRAGRGSKAVHVPPVPSAPR